MVHGSLRNETMEYVLDEESARATFRLLDTAYCLVGHSHLPFICEESSGSPRFLEFVEGRAYPLGDRRLIINPGEGGPTPGPGPSPQLRLLRQPGRDGQQAPGYLPVG